jgi:fatty acid desaturase
MKPQLPEKPPSLETPREDSNSSLMTILTLLLLGGVLVGLVFLSLGSILGPLLLLLLVLPAIAMFHYLLWGWWLGKAIERDANENE